MLIYSVGNFIEPVHDLNAGAVKLLETFSSLKPLFLVCNSCNPFSTFISSCIVLLGASLVALAVSDSD